MPNTCRSATGIIEQFVLYSNMVSSQSDWWKTAHFCYISLHAFLMPTSVLDSVPAIYSKHNPTGS
jgi:hypothetical protein